MDHACLWDGIGWCSQQAHVGPCTTAATALSFWPYHAIRKGTLQGYRMWLPRNVRLKTWSKNASARRMQACGACFLRSRDAFPVPAISQKSLRYILKEWMWCCAVRGWAFCLLLVSFLSLCFLLLFLPFTSFCYSTHFLFLVVMCNIHLCDLEVFLN